MNNYEKIKSMTVKELAKALKAIAGCCSEEGGCDFCPLENCRDCFSQYHMEEWLEKEIEEE